MEASVIVASGRKDIHHRLQFLTHLDADFDYEIIVVHDASNPPSKRTEGVIYMESDTPNPAAKRNAGAAASRGKVLAFIDDDAVAPREWLKKGLKLLEKHPLAAGCGGPNLAPVEQTPAEELTDAVLSSKLGSGSGSYGGSGESHQARVGEIHLVNFFVRRDVFEAVGGFNEALGYGAEDSEFVYLCHRMAGGYFIFDPELFVIHDRRPFGRELFSQRWRLRKQNGRLLWLRPGMYVTGKFGAALAATPVFLWLLLEWPPLILPATAGYLALLGRESLRIKSVSRLKWMGAVALLHAVSAAGVLAGWLRIPSGSSYRELLRRPG